MSTKVDFDKVLEALETIAGMSDVVKQVTSKKNELHPGFKVAMDGFYDGYSLGCKNSRDYLIQQYERGKLS